MAIAIAVARALLPKIITNGLINESNEWGGVVVNQHN